MTLSIVLGPKVMQLLVHGDIDGLRKAMRSQTIKDNARRASERSESSYETTVPMAMDQTIQIKGETETETESTYVGTTSNAEESSNGNAAETA